VKVYFIFNIDPILQMFSILHEYYHYAVFILYNYSISWLVLKLRNLSISIIFMKISHELDDMLCIMLDIFNLIMDLCGDDNRLLFGLFEWDYFILIFCIGKINDYGGLYLLIEGI
jgi:hypothetical protein